MELLEFQDYAQAESARVKNSLPKLENGSLRFAFITDLHYKFITEMRTTVSNLIHAVNELNNTTKLDFICFGGDNVGNYPNSKEEHIKMMEELAVLTENCNIPVFFLQGNHDDNSIHGKIENTTSCRTGFEVPNAIQHKIFFARSEKYFNYHPGGEKTLYGYYDIPNAKTRVILLNSSDVPYILDGDVMRYNQQWDFGYGGKQLEWLCKEALASAPENIILMQHMPFDQIRHPSGEETRYNIEAFEKILSAFINGESIHITNDHPDFGFDICADFSGEKHNAPAGIAGHCHVDTQSMTSYGLLSITTMLAGRKNSGMGAGDDGIVYEREPYSATETSMDIFTFDPEKYTLTATRYGSGKDRTFEIKKLS